MDPFPCGNRLKQQLSSPKIQTMYQKSVPPESFTKYIYEDSMATFTNYFKTKPEGEKWLVCFS